MEEAFDMYWRDVLGYGPRWDPMLQYWKEGKERPDEVLFFKYEEMKERQAITWQGWLSSWDTHFHLRKKMGCLSRYKNCGIRGEQDWQIYLNFDNKNLFRKGEVGDWVNYLTPIMAERLKKLMEDKLAGSGLDFNLNIN